MHLPKTLLLLAAVVSTVPGGASCAGPAIEESPWKSWTHLQFKARAAPFIRGKLEMLLTALPEGRRLETRTTASFLGKQLVRSRTWSDFAQTGRTTDYVSLSSERGRRYRFGDDAYTVDKLRSEEASEVLDDSWRVLSTQEHAFPVDGPENRAVAPMDYYGMILHLRDLPLREPDDEATVWVATSDGPQPFRIVVGERRTGQRRYRDLTTDIEKEDTLTELRLRVIPADPERADEGFLRMEGETEIWVEARYKTLLEISGKVPRVPGRVRLRLVGMESSGGR